MTGAARAFVVDASMALSWCFEGEDSPRSDTVLARLEHDRAIAPAIWPLEVANGLRTAERRGRLDEGSVSEVTRLLMTLPILVEEPLALDAALERVLPLARMVGLTAYDASYLDLATRHGLPLATADDQLARAARASGVELVEPEA